MRNHKNNASGIYKTTNLFAYGTLMVPRILTAVTGRVFSSMDARLRDYARYRLKGEVYPGLVYRKGSETAGKVYYALDEVPLARLDDFEGGYYERISVTVTIEGADPVDAFTYLIRPEFQDLLSEQAWDFADFLARDSRVFVDTYAGFKGRAGE